MAALELEWAFGINSDVKDCVHLLPTNGKGEEMIFYPVSNNGVIYNINTKQQIFLSLHTNIITASIVSSDKNLIILGDSGASNHSSVISIWNSTNYELIAQYQLPRNFGVEALAINSESNLLSAIINESIPSIDDRKDEIVQHLILFALTNQASANDDEEIIDFNLLSQHKIVQNSDRSLYHFICFNQTSTEIVIHGQNIHNLIFWSIQFVQNNENEEIDLKLKPYYTQKSDNINNIDLSAIGNLTASIFFPAPNSPLITATDCGDLIIWDFEEKKANNLLIDIDEDADAENADPDMKHRVLCKVINKISRGAINCVSILNNNNIIALASSSGSVRFFDFEFRVIGWLDYLGDPVISVSFPLDIPKYKDLDTVNNEFTVPAMIIGTKNNKIIKVTAPNLNDEDGNLDPTHCVIIETFNTVCTAMSAHPSLPLLAVGNKNGDIQIWDIMNKSILQTIALSQPQFVTDIKFAPTGKWMVFGTDSKYFRIYDTQKFEEKQFFKTNYGGIICNLCFSFDGEWIAFSQSNRISVYRYWYNIQDVKKEKAREWTLIGNYKSHKKDITSLHFSLPSGIDGVSQRKYPRLFSVGYDNLVNEYNLQRSSPNRGLSLKYTYYLKRMSTPTSLQFISGLPLKKEDLMTYAVENDVEDVIAPKYDEQKHEWKYVEDLLYVFDDELKIHAYHAPRAVNGRFLTTADTQILNSGKKGDDENEEEKDVTDPILFRRTVLGPSFGAPIQKVVALESDGGVSKTFLFCTYAQTIGLMQSPFNGNPHRYFGCIAHPGKINGFEVMMNGEYLVSNGGYDKSMLIWKINKDALNKQVSACDEENSLNQIYKDLLFEDINTKELDLYEEIKNYFYFVQIENQGAMSTVPRSISGKINIKQIASIFQAMGCFLTNNDIERIESEIKHRFGNTLNSSMNNVTVNLGQFVELFVNHRSPFELSMDELHRAFMSIVEQQPMQSTIGNKPSVIHRTGMTREFFLETLQRKGDKMTRDELMNCFESLTGYNSKQLSKVLPQVIDTDFFTHHILGLKAQSN